MKALRLLVITKHLLDPRDAQAQQSSALIGALAATAGHIDVVTGALSASPAPDFGHNVIVHALPARWVSHRQSLLAKVVRKLQRNFDACVTTSWARCAAAVTNELMASEHYDAIISMALPMESHIAALNANRKTPWIAYMSDPWPESSLPAPYSDFAVPLLNAMQKRLVSKVFDEADALVFSCLECIDWLTRFYVAIDRDKSHVIPHVAPNSTTECPTPGASGEELILVHGGALSRERVCPALAEALGRLPPESKWTLRLIGQTHQDMLDAFERAGAMGRVRVEGWMSKREALEALSSGHALLLIEARMSHYPFLPSKLADYAAIGKPIIAITGNESATARLIRATRSGLVSAHQADSILKVMMEMEASSSEYSSATLLELFQPSSVAASYVELVQSLSTLRIAKDAVPLP